MPKTKISTVYTIQDSFTPYRGRQVKTFGTLCMYLYSSIVRQIIFDKATHNVIWWILSTLSV